MTRLLILAGGKSEEHEVSLLSAHSMAQAISGSGIQPTVLVVTREGRWLNPDESRAALDAGSAKQGGRSVLSSAQICENFDVVFPLMHGPFGEDGTIQGMLELAGIPYVGAGVLGSALCMDKPMAKDVLAQHGLKQTAYCVATRGEFEQRSADVVERCSKLAGPWFIKPANLGSSVGISKAKTKTELKQCIQTAFKFDRRVIVESSIEKARELEVGILGNDVPEASSVGEITYDAEFYDYETKYTDGRAQLHIPAQISAPLATRIQQLAKQAFTALDCSGFARVDFFYQTYTDLLYINELNTIPGFTPYSMFPKLWQHAGVSYPALIQKLIELALEKKR